MNKEEILALAESIDANGGGCMFANYDGLEAFIQALVESREELRQALHSIASWNEGEEVSVRFDEPGSASEAREALANDDARLASLGF